MADLAQTNVHALPVAKIRRARFSWAWLGVMPFFLFALMFLILPTLDLVAGAFRTPDGGYTLDNIRRLNNPTILSAYWIDGRVRA
jgi:putative spermidine/putrescine transport system permease protein